MLGNQQDRNDYNIGSSEAAQSNFEAIASALEAALARREADVRNVAAQVQIDGASEAYVAAEQEWNKCGNEVRNIISLCRKSLQENDDIARTAIQMAARAVPN